MATDGDLPANRLMYSFVLAPPGATIDAITGEIAWTSVDGGAYDFIVQVTDNGGMFDTEDFTVNVNQIEDCLFEPGDWTFGESGGLNGMAGSGVAQGCTVVLEEGNSFEVLASISFDVPQNTSHFVFEYSGLNFDGADAGSISDAFEAALVDANGNSLVHTIGENRDAFFNTSESPIESAGANTVVNGNTISVDLTHLTPGTTATLRLRLVNNDNDTNTRVTVKPIAFELGSLGTPLGVTSPANTEILEVIDFSALTDVTGSLQANFQTTSFNAQSDRLFSDITFTNNANHPIDGPFILVVSDITDPTVVAAGTDGVTPDGDRYYQINDLSDLNTIAPGR